MIHLIIAGHGTQYDGSFDPGATGYISKGEHKYVRDDLFPAMKRYETGDDTFIFYHAKKVSSHGNLTELVKYFNADEVTEIHFDAHRFGSTASGGHVIIHSDYTPDDMDLKLRDAIQSMVGVRYSHRGHKGISGRNNLYNVNEARKNGITYRLIELGFGTNRTDASVMIGSVDAYAKALMQALQGKVNKKPSPPVKEDIALSINDMADMILYNNNAPTGHSARRKWLGVDNSTYQKVRNEVNRRAGVKSAPKKKKGKSINQMADMIMYNKNAPKGHGARRKWLGVDNATYQKVRAEVNRRYR